MNLLHVSLLQGSLIKWQLQAIRHHHPLSRESRLSPLPKLCFQTARLFVALFCGSFLQQSCSLHFQKCVQYNTTANRQTYEKSVNWKCFRTPLTTINLLYWLPCEPTIYGCKFLFNHNHGYLDILNHSTWVFISALLRKSLALLLQYWNKICGLTSQFCHSPCYWTFKAQYLRLGPWIFTGSLLLARIWEHCWQTQPFPLKVTLSPMGKAFL